MTYPQQNIDEIPPLAVTLTAASLADLTAALKGSAGKGHYDVTFRTIVLTAPTAGNQAVGTSIRPLCAADLSREYIVVQAFTNDAVLCETQSKAQDPANAVAGLPNPEGYLLKATNTAPTMLPMTDQAWVAAAAYPCIVTVALVNRVKG